MQPTFLIAAAIILALSCASALVARAAAREARSALRQTRTDLEALFLQVSALSAAIRRVEGRQTGLLRNPKQVLTDDGLPDPLTNPEGWRAAVRRMGAHQSLKNKGEH
jgi:beta-phosphoglucomutase-like phosphatase (HAD superfamily)